MHVGEGQRTIVIVSVTWGRHVGGCYGDQTPQQESDDIEERELGPFLEAV